MNPDKPVRAPAVAPAAGRQQAQLSGVKVTGTNRGCGIAQWRRELDRPAEDAARIEVDREA
jgi:hypothetical protein